MKEAGKFNKIQTLMGMDGMCLYALSKLSQPHPWSVEEVQAYLEKVRTEVNNPQNSYLYSISPRLGAKTPGCID